MILLSRDLRRVLGLPERDPPAPDAREIPRSSDPCGCAAMDRKCIEHLLGSQRAALEEMRVAKGLFGMLSVGSGKTGLGILSPIALNLSPAVILLPPGQLWQTVEEATWIGQHLRVPRVHVVESGARPSLPQPVVPGTSSSHDLYLVPYSVISRPESSDLLERLAPKVLIADEAHKLRHIGEAATTRRVFRYLAKHDDNAPDRCLFLCWSGTLTSKSIKDYAHLSAFSLRQGSPLPLDQAIIAQWAECFDAGQNSDVLVGAFAEYLHPGEDPREGFRRRLFRTAGVIGSVAAAAETLPPLSFEVLPIGVPEAARDALRQLDSAWVLPDGEELILATEIWRARTELLCGFFYRWVWPDAVPEADRTRWAETRSIWHRELRGRLARSRRVGLDSPHLLEQAMLAGTVPSSDAFEEWNVVRRETPAPDTVPTWLDDGEGWIEDVVRLARERRALVWFTHDAVGRVLERHLPTFFEAQGMVADLKTKKAPAAALSIKACGQGVDGLQRMYQEQVVICPFSSGEGWEQLLGRLHRQGQEGAVRTAIFARDADFVAGAMEAARYVRQTMGLEQKLLIASGLEGIEGGSMVLESIFGSLLRGREGEAA